MTAGITNVRIDLSRVPKFRAVLARAVDRGVGRAAIVFEAAAKTAIRNTGGAGVGGGKVWNKPSHPGGFPASQSGRLRNSITSERASWAVYRVGTNVAYGKHLEFGAHPRAKRGKYLTVPMNYEASRLLKRAGSVRNIPGLKIIARTRRGWLLGFKAGTSRVVRGKTSKVRNTKALFALVPDVTILPRPWLLPTKVSKANQAAALAEFRKTVDAGIKSAIAGVGGVSV